MIVPGHVRFALPLKFHSDTLVKETKLTQRVFNTKDLIPVQTGVGAGDHDDGLSGGLGKGLELRQGRRRREGLGILATRKSVTVSMNKT